MIERDPHDLPREPGMSVPHAFFSLKTPRPQPLISSTKRSQR